VDLGLGLSKDEGKEPNKRGKMIEQCKGKRRAIYTKGVVKKVKGASQHSRKLEKRKKNTEKAEAGK